jgi:predicted metal-dependent hydrolase
MSPAQRTHDASSSVAIVVDELLVTVTRKRIRRAYLGVHPPDGRVTVSAPLRTSDRAIRTLVRDGRDWIERHRARILAEEARTARAPRPRLRAVEGETWPVLGRPHRLTVREGGARPLARLAEDGLILLHLPDVDDERARLAAMERLLRRHLRAVAAPIIADWADRIGVRPSFLGIRRMRTQWGSCIPSRGRIWLSLELVTRPVALIEYVAVHELLHFCELSHGLRFERLMDLHVPDWRQRRDALDARPDAQLAR